MGSPSPSMSRSLPPTGREFESVGHRLDDERSGAAGLLHGFILLGSERDVAGTVFDQLHVHPGELPAHHGGDDHPVVAGVHEGYGRALPSAQVAVSVEPHYAHVRQRAVDAHAVVASRQGQILDGQTQVGQLVIDDSHVLGDVHRASRTHDDALVAAIASQRRSTPPRARRWRSARALWPVRRIPRLIALGFLLASTA